MKKGFILKPQQGDLYIAAGTKTIVKLHSKQSDGRFSIVEYLLPPMFPGPPAHVHREFGHFWYVLQGTMTVQFEDQHHPAVEGTSIFVPPGVAHTFSNPGMEPCRILAIDTPGGLERYYEELASSFPPGSAVDPEKIAAIQGRFDTFPPRN